MPLLGRPIAERRGRAKGNRCSRRRTAGRRPLDPPWEPLEGGGRRDHPALGQRASRGESGGIDSGNPHSTPAGTAMERETAPRGGHGQPAAGGGTAALRSNAPPCSRTTRSAMSMRPERATVGPGTRSSAATRSNTA